MAEEKKILTKEELRVKAEELCKSYNDANQSGDFATAAKCNDDIEQVVNEYTALIREETFKALSETEDPMLEAVKQLRLTVYNSPFLRQGLNRHSFGAHYHT